MGENTGQAPAYGHINERQQGIQGLEVSTIEFFLMCKLTPGAASRRTFCRHEKRSQ